MKALTLHQPWASLIAIGVKSIETRSWSTKYRGPLAIHASAKRTRAMSCNLGQWRYGGLTGCLWRAAPQVRDLQYVRLGVVVATCTLVDVVPTYEIEWGCRFDANSPMWWWDDGIEQVGEGRDGEPIGDLARWASYVVDEDQRPYGDFTPGRFAWLLADVTPLDPPVPAKGRQGLWDWKPTVADIVGIVP